MRTTAILLRYGGFVLICGVFLTAIVIVPLSQGLIDSDDDAVVLFAIRYLKWVALLVCLLGGAAGTAVGTWAVRHSVEPRSNS